MVTFRDVVELVRAPAGLSVPGDALAGAAAAGTLGRRTAGLAAASVCLYWAGMAANDWADREIDAKERPERPIPSGRVAPATAFRVAAGFTAAGLALAGAAGGRRALAMAIPLTAAIWAYDTALKGTPAGPVAMAACRGLDVMLGASSGRLRRAVAPALTVAAHTYTVTVLSRREVDGGEPRLPAATLAGTAAITAAAALPRSPVSRWSRVAAAALAGWYGMDYGATQSRAVADPSAARIRACVGAGITGLPTLQGALIARSGASIIGASVAGATLLGRRLAKRFSPT